MRKEGNTLGKRISRFILVISAVSIALRLYLKGMLDAQKAAIFLLIVVIAAAIDSVWIKLILALFGLGYFVFEYLDYDLVQFKTAAVSLLALLIALFGIFIMLGGLRKK